MGTRIPRVRIPHLLITAVILTQPPQEASPLQIHHPPGHLIILLRHVQVEVVILPLQDQAEVTQVVVTQAAATQAAAGTEDNKI
jgi:hypothetical protein